MIRTLVVDDDFMAAAVHRSFTEKVPGFEVVGEATTGAGALAAVEELHPDLLLLDIYLPDLSGLEVMRRLRQGERGDGPPVDVIAITSAKDVRMLRSAMHHGVVHYLIKPFTFATFRERLESYAALRARLERMHQADQHEVDRLYGLLRTGGDEALPKGISRADARSSSPTSSAARPRRSPRPTSPSRPASAAAPRAATSSSSPSRARSS